MYLFSYFVLYWIYVYMVDEGYNIATNFFKQKQTMRVKVVTKTDVLEMEYFFPD